MNLSQMPNGNKDNPFFYNYIFSKADLDRCKWSYWRYPLLFFCPTFIQYTADGVAYYKQWGNKYFFIKIEALPEY